MRKNTVTNKALVTIVVPTYNAEKYLTKCLDSLVRQTYNNVEIIIVDDCSTDNTKNIAESLLKGYNAMVLKQSSNQGPLAARCCGAKRAKGQFIVFCDADDYLDVDCIKKLVNYYIESNADLIIANRAQEYGNKIVTNRLKMKIGVYKTKEILPIQISDGSLSGMLVSSQCFKLYKKELVDQFIDVIPKAIRTNEDGVFNTYYLLQTNTIQFVDDCVYYERHIGNPKNRFARFNDERFLEANVALSLLKNNWPDINNFELQMMRKKTFDSFCLCIEACNYYSIKNATNKIRDILYLDSTFKRRESVRIKKVRKHKNIMYKLLLTNHYALFYVMIKYGGKVTRPLIAR